MNAKVELGVVHLINDLQKVYLKMRELNRVLRAERGFSLLRK